MDVLELPRPVINFLRTMAKESCRYALSWDIFGGPDSVTLTLTWKLIDEEPASSLINDASSASSKQPVSFSPAVPIYDEPHTRSRAGAKSSQSSSSPRRSRRDETAQSNENASVPAIFRSSRGKSLEGSNLQSTKPLAGHHQHVKEHHPVSSLERNTLANHYHPPPPHHHRPKKDSKPLPTPSDQIYGHLYDTRSASVVKCATISSLSSSSPSPQPNNNPPLSMAHTHHPRPKAQPPPITPPTLRKTTRSPAPMTTRPPVTNTPPSTYARLRRTNHIASPDDDDDDTLDPWVKRFECSLEDNDLDETTEHFEEKESSAPAPVPNDAPDESGLTSGKVKFKTKPDYFWSGNDRCLELFFLRFSGEDECEKNREIPFWMDGSQCAIDSRLCSRSIDMCFVVSFSYQFFYLSRSLLRR